MALIKELTVGDDGVPIIGYRQEPLDPDRPVLLTGPVSGQITLEDGTAYDVTEYAIELRSTEHRDELAHKIGLHHERHGHPSHTSRFDDDYDPIRDEFQHVCNDVCGIHARSHEEHVAAFNDRLARLGHADRVDGRPHQQLVARLAVDYAAPEDKPAKRAALLRLQADHEEAGEE